MSDAKLMRRQHVCTSLALVRPLDQQDLPTSTAQMLFHFSRSHWSHLRLQRTVYMSFRTAPNGFPRSFDHG
jgi:hypothetical protein